jgi:uncharacterized protein YecT (DUF1311 family)
MARLRRGLCLSLFALAVSNAPCFAQRSDAPKHRCQGLANVPTSICFEGEYEKANDELKAFLAQIRGALTRPDDRERLDQAQTAWKKGRDLTCDADSQLYFGGGSGQGTEATICLDVETRLRLKDLHAIYDWRIEWMRRQRE